MEEFGRAVNYNLGPASSGRILSQPETKRRMSSRPAVHASSIVAQFPRSSWGVPAMTVVIVLVALATALVGALALLRSGLKLSKQIQAGVGVTLGRAGAPAAAAGACPRSRCGPIQRAP